MAGRPHLFVLAGLCACVWAVVALHVSLAGGLAPASLGVGVLSMIIAGGSFIHARLGVPRIQGTWWGELRSNYTDPVTGRTSGPIPVAFVIRQSATGLVARLYSQESSSVSIAATLMVDDEHPVLAGVYRNEPRLPRQDTSRMHYGGIKLQVIDGAEKRLHGTYWTDRGTWGEIELRFVTARRAHGFVDASELAEREGVLVPPPADHMQSVQIVHSVQPDVLPALPISAEFPSASQTPEEALCKLLESRFKGPELRRFIANVASRDAVARLPAEGTPLAELAFAVVELLHRDRLLDKAFEHLLGHPPASPAWHAEVESVRKRFSDAADSRGWS